MVDLYADLGYGVLALTDHDTVRGGQTTWPWQSFGRDPAALGMVAVEGNEISRLHHLGSLFNDYGDAKVESESAAIAEIGRRHGLSIMHHPGRYDRTIDWYVALFHANPHLLGLEIYNQGDRYPVDRDTWDKVLSRLIHERPVWAFSGDDMHKPGEHLGRNWNVLLLPELTPEAVRRTMIAGTFFYVYAPQGHAGPPVPVIRAIRVDREQGVIELDVAGESRIEWVSGGKVVSEGARIELSTLSGLGAYVRATVYTDADGPLIGTQPFRLIAE